MLRHALFTRVGPLAIASWLSLTSRAHADVPPEPQPNDGCGCATSGEGGDPARVVLIGTVLVGVSRRRRPARAGRG